MYHVLGLHSSGRTLWVHVFSWMLTTRLIFVAGSASAISAMAALSRSAANSFRVPRKPAAVSSSESTLMFGHDADVHGNEAVAGEPCLRGQEPMDRQARERQGLHSGAYEDEAVLGELLQVQLGGGGGPHGGFSFHVSGGRDMP